MASLHDNDAFDDDERLPTIVDCDVLEAAKENIQPLAKGRRVTALSAILSTPHALRESRLASTRNRLRINVEIALEDEADDSDPLEAYCRLVYWVVENYPQGPSAESGLLELLEEATRVLKDDRDGKWRGDLRYLKLWVLYASYVEKPAIIFKFCLVNEIGANHALLYEEFATALERANRKPAADEIYRLGIARRAAPLEKLESRYRGFQKRLMTQISPPAPDQPTVQSSIATPSTTKPRKVLGETMRPRPATPTAPHEAADVFTAPAPASTARPRPNAKMQVFVDPAGTEAPETEAAPWPELGTRKSRVKENLVEVRKFAGTTLRQPGRAKREAAARAPKMEIYRDPEEGTDDERRQDDISAQPEQSDSTSIVRPAEAPERREGNERTVLSASDVATDLLEQAVNHQSLEDAPVPVPVAAGRVTRSTARAAKALNASDSGALAVPSVPEKKKTRNTRAASKAATAHGIDALPVSLMNKKSKRTVSKGSNAVSGDVQTPASPSTFLKGKAKLTIFRDEPELGTENVRSPTAPTTTSNDKTSSALGDGSEEDKPPAPASVPSKASGSLSSKFTIFRDDSDDHSSGRNNNNKATSSKFAVFRDTEEEVRPSAPPGAGSGKGKALASKFVIYRDDEADAQDAENVNVPATLPPPVKKGRVASGSKIAVFRDPEDPAHGTQAKTPAAKPRTKIAVYRDEPEAGGSTPAVPSTPRFVPYRDEEVPSSPTTRNAASMSVMKEKPVVPVGTRGVTMSSEGDALRKDPLKNYAEEERILDMD